MNPADFERFMREVHGHPPFPWQTAVVAETVARGDWPALVDAPTGLGKTSMLDVAVFLSAMSAGGDAPAGLGRRRIYLVVDRRIVVDQAAEHGRRIARALDTAAPGTLCAEVAQRLRRLSGAPETDATLAVVTMRGGLTWDAAWLPRPDLPAIVTGTVDQVGSRLYFRGYGVSPRRRPIDAALVGTDSVIMIDEAHVARAFTASLASCREFDASGVLGPAETSVVHLSATGEGPSHGWVAAFDESAHLDHGTARRRLTASKTLSFVESSPRGIVTDIASRAAELAGAAGARVLVVCNTVGRAREVYQALTSGRSTAAGAEVLLLTGRSRPLDRERIAARVTALFGADRPPATDAAVLVATQTVEVGIDLDATDLVTETAPWDSLVQRFGRVNRRGALSAASVTVVEDGDARPPVYGPPKVATAAFLKAAASEGLDVSPLALRHLTVPGGLVASPPVLPLLLPAHLDAWTRTSPAPANDPPLDPYLHGIDTSTAPVTVVWRDGLLDALGEPLSADEAQAVVELVAVRSEETAEIPLGAVRAWLMSTSSAPIGDVEEYDDIPFGDDDAGRVVLRRSGDGAWRWVPADSLRPGDVVIVPGEYGGLDRFGWDPESTAPVRDVAELAALRRGQAVLRVDATLADRLGMPVALDTGELLAQWRDADEPEEREKLREQLVDAVREWLDTAGEPAPESPWTPEDLARLRDVLGRGVGAAAGDESVCPVLRASSPTGWRAVDEDTAADTSSLNRRVGLAEHLMAVGDRAEEIASHLGLPGPLRRVVVDAARWHDLGKVDRRFQAMLFGGSAIAAELADEPLAKSGMPPGDRERHRRALRLSGLPRGARHEAWSEAIVAAHVAELPEPYPGDAELLAHLVASHHGHARPLLPPVDDPGAERLEADIGDVAVCVAPPAGVRVSDADRFARLNERYGRWGLALLEAVVRCADMTVSSEGS